MKVWTLSKSLASREEEGIPIKIGGVPDPAGKLGWPSCSACGEKMRFLLQVPHSEHCDLSPFRAIYVFQCENKQSVCFAWRPDRGGNRVLAVTKAEPELLNAPDDPGYPEQHLRVVPGIEDERVLSIDLEAASLSDLDAYEKAKAKAPSSKLGGLPCWPQADATPSCCEAPMELIAQVDGAEWGLHFGDEGVGFVFGCQSKGTSCGEPFRFLWQS